MSLITLAFSHEAFQPWHAVLAHEGRDRFQGCTALTECRGMVPRLPSPRGPSVDLADWPAQRRTSHE